jgi:hypothetical protein
MLVVRRCAVKKYFVTGILSSIITGGLLVIGMGALHMFPPLYEALICVPGGLLAGLIGDLLENKFTKTPLHTIGFVILTIVLSLVFSICLIGLLYFL